MSDADDRHFTFGMLALILFYVSDHLVLWLALACFEFLLAATIAALDMIEKRQKRRRNL